MDIKRIPQIKNYNLLETQIRNFSSYEYILNKIGNKFNSFNSIETFKKKNLLEEKTKNYFVKINNLHLNKKGKTINVNKISKNFENDYIKRTLKRNCSANVLSFRANHFKDNNTLPPLKKKYKILLKNFSRGHRYLKNLTNKELDEIFNEKIKISSNIIKNIIDFNNKRLIDNNEKITSDLGTDSFYKTKDSNISNISKTTLEKFIKNYNDKKLKKVIKASDLKKVNSMRPIFQSESIFSKNKFYIPKFNNGLNRKNRCRSCSKII